MLFGTNETLAVTVLLLFTTMLLSVTMVEGQSLQEKHGSLRQPEKGKEKKKEKDHIVNDGCESAQCWDNTICEWISSCDVVGECGEYNEFCLKKRKLAVA
mmetsp:Transcript_22219/g.22537  ORF Transcript_22219/g.22537 Transcript_22219/m.22537 type:complete len:100 (-) Transcript_22219:190-489(-)